MAPPMGDARVLLDVVQTESVWLRRPPSRARAGDATSFM
jgi:hypothetical protein